jgi:hypothetical protein
MSDETPSPLRRRRASSVSFSSSHSPTSQTQGVRLRRDSYKSDRKKYYKEITVPTKEDKQEASVRTPQEGSMISGQSYPALRCPQLGAVVIALNYLLWSDRSPALAKENVSPLDLPDRVTLESIFRKVRLPLRFATETQLTVHVLHEIILQFIEKDSRFADCSVDLCMLDVQRLSDEGVVDLSDAAPRQLSCILSDFRSELQTDSVSRNRVKIVCYDPLYLQGTEIGNDDEEDDLDNTHYSMAMLSSFVSPNIKADKKNATELSNPAHKTQTAVVADVHAGTQMVELAIPTFQTDICDYGAMLTEYPLHALHRAIAARCPSSGRAHGFISIKKKLMVTSPGSGSDSERQNLNGSASIPTDLRSPTKNFGPNGSVSFGADDSQTMLDEPPSLTKVELSLKENTPGVKPDPLFRFHPLSFEDIDRGVANHLKAVAYALFVLERGNDPGFETIHGGAPLAIKNIVRTLSMSSEHVCHSPLRVDQVYCYAKAYLERIDSKSGISLLPVLRKRHRRGAPCTVSVQALGELLRKVTDYNLNGVRRNGAQQVRLPPALMDQRAVSPENGLTPNGCLINLETWSPAFGPDSSPLGGAPAPLSIDALHGSTTSTSNTPPAGVERIPPAKPRVVMLCCHDPNVLFSTVNITGESPTWSIFNGYSEISHAVQLLDTSPQTFGRSNYVALEDLHTALIGNGVILIGAEGVDVEDLIPSSSDPIVQAYTDEFRSYAPHPKTTSLKHLWIPTRQHVPLAVAALAISELGIPTTLGDFLRWAPSDPSHILTTDISMQDFARVINCYLKGQDDIAAHCFFPTQSFSRFASVAFVSTIKTALQEGNQVVVNYTRRMIPSAPPQLESSNYDGGQGDFALICGFVDGKESQFLLVDANPESCHRSWAVDTIDVFKASQDVCPISRRHRGLVLVGKNRKVANLFKPLHFRSGPDGQGWPTDHFLVPMNHPFRPTLFPLCFAYAMALSAFGIAVTAEDILYGAFAKGDTLKGMEDSQVASQNPVGDDSDGPSNRFCNGRANRLLGQGRRLIDLDSGLLLLQQFLANYETPGKVVTARKVEWSMVQLKPRTKDRLYVAFYDVHKVHSAPHSYTGVGIPFLLPDDDDGPVEAKSVEDEGPRIAFVDAEASTWGAVWSKAASDLNGIVYGVVEVSTRTIAPEATPPAEVDLKPHPPAHQKS